VFLDGVAACGQKCGLGMVVNVIRGSNAKTVWDSVSFAGFVFYCVCLWFDSSQHHYYFSPLFFIKTGFLIKNHFSPSK
jgi:hypothetical protein